MLGIDRKCQPIEKTATLGGWPGEQLIHCGHQPDDAQVIGEGAGGGHRLAIDAALAGDGDVLVGRRLDAGAERRQAKRAFDIGCHRPGAVAFHEGDLGEGGASQPAPGCEKRYGFNQVGLARAIRSDQHHQIGGNVDLRGLIAAEVIECEAADAGGGHGRTRKTTLASRL
jgi:hypothetical protein